MSQDSQIQETGENVKNATQEAYSEVAAPLPEDDNLRQEDPIMILVFLGISLFILKMWWDDYKSEKAGKPNSGALPGTTGCSRLAIGIAVVGSLILLAIETGGEYALGISAEQSDITWLFLLSMISAAFIEELIFRGFLVVDKKGTAAFLGSIVGFSLLFALFHPFLWQMDFAEGVPAWQIWNADFSWDFSTKAFFSTGMIFAGSLWFYAVRFYKWNPTHSLLPCFAAHLSKNLGVFAIKLAQGHVVAPY